jgi:hypothetical protein
MLFVTIGACFFFGLLLFFVLPRLNGEEWTTAIKKALSHPSDAKEGDGQAVSPPGVWHS